MDAPPKAAWDGPTLKAARMAAGWSQAVLGDFLVSSQALVSLWERGTRDRAILMTGFASGGRRRSEIAAFQVEICINTD